MWKKEWITAPGMEMEWGKPMINQYSQRGTFYWLCTGRCKTVHEREENFSGISKPRVRAMEKKNKRG